MKHIHWPYYVLRTAQPYMDKDNRTVTIHYRYFLKD